MTLLVTILLLLSCDCVRVRVQIIDSVAVYYAPALAPLSS